MEAQIPLDLEFHLQEMGVMSTEHEELDDPVGGHYVGPVGTFDEDGEPEW